MCVVFSMSYFHLFSLFFDLECLQCNLNLVRESEKRKKNWKKNLAKLTGIFWQKKVKIYVWIYRYFSMSKIVWIQFRCCSTKHIFPLSFFNIGKPSDEIIIYSNLSLNIFIYRIFREIEKKPHVLDLVLELFMHTEM